jgi:hypothetical protein
MKNIINAYGFVMVLVLFLFLVITVRVIDIYYSHEVENVLESRVEQLESLFTSYIDAGSVLETLNSNYIDKAIYEREQALMAVYMNAPQSEREKLSESVFAMQQCLRFDIVDPEAYSDFMTRTYQLNIEGYDSAPIYYDAYLDGHRNRIMSMYSEVLEAVVVYSEDVSRIDEKQARFVEAIYKRVEEHMQRTPMDVHVSLIDRNGSVLYRTEDASTEDLPQTKDILSGLTLLDRIVETNNGTFDYQIKQGSSAATYLAVVKNSPEYGAYLDLTLEKQSFLSSLGNVGKLVFRIVQLGFVGLVIWTVVRLRKVITGTGLWTKQRENDKGSIF